MTTTATERDWRVEYVQAHVLILKLAEALEDSALKTTVAEAVDWDAHREANITPALAAYREWRNA